MKKKIRLLFSLLLVVQLFPISPIFAETVQDVPVGETTISSKAEDPLKEYKEKVQNQVPTVESTVSQDVPGVEKEAETSPEETEKQLGESPTPTNDSIEEQEITNQRFEPRGGIVPLAGTTLVEGLPGDPFPYDIDKNFADVIRSIYPTAPDPMTDDFMESLTYLYVNNRGLTSLKGIEYAINIMNLNCSYNQLTELDVQSNTLLQNLECQDNQIVDLNTETNTILRFLICFGNQISSLDLSHNTELRRVDCYDNRLLTLDISSCTKLEQVDCTSNRLIALDVSNTPLLKYLKCSVNQITQIDLSNNDKLVDFWCHSNKIVTLDLSVNLKLKDLNCNGNQLTNLDVSNNTALVSLTCGDNSLSSLDLSNNLLLERLFCNSNQLTDLGVSNSTALSRLECNNNKLSSLNLSSNLVLQRLEAKRNNISDITGLSGLANLTYMDISEQVIYLPVPNVSGNQTTIDILKTTAQIGIKQPIINNINPVPTSIVPNGDKIELVGVTRDSLSDKSIEFEYEGALLSEGANPYSTKKFSGTITFAVASELKNELEVVPKRANKDDEIEWTWTITSLTTKKAEDIKATFTLPNYLTGDISDIQITHQPSATTQAGTINHLNGTDSLGDLDQGESIEITFKSIARGDPDAWYEAVGRLDWSDDTPSSPHYNESKQQFKIIDEEQTDTPKDSEDMGILSVPIYFNFGTQDIYSTLQTYALHTQDYQSNTNVVTDGFYTRIKDERSASTGWKLTAGLSEFVDGFGIAMPNGSGTSLKLDNMYIQKVTDRDTPQTLVSASATEGDGTWQLRMPFDDLSLNVPANAGKKGTVYKAKLTWSLNNTP